VVIPAFNVGDCVREVVEAVIRSQNCGPLQVVVVDDGNNSGLEKVLAGTGAEIVSTGGCGSAAMARNRGALGFTGKFLVFIDSDVLVDAHCIARLLEPLRNGEAEASMGNYSKDVAGMSFASRYKQLYISRIYDRRSGYVQNDFWSAMAAMDTAVFRQLNGFDPSFVGACGEDGELGGRLTRSGYRILPVPGALGNHRKPLSVPQLLRNDWRKGMIAIHNYFRCDGSLGDNRHATKRDILAVALAAAAFPISGLAFVFSALSGSVAACTLAIGYVVARADVLRVFASQGAFFVARACGVMFMLDLIRLLCVIAGFSLRLVTPMAAAPAVRKERVTERA
jgi:GT2 family glycosyltransferase